MAFEFWMAFIFHNPYGTLYTLFGVLNPNTHSSFIPQGDEDYETVWKQHSQDVESLQKYAEAMHKLATQHWVGAGETRIDWCRQVALDYFLKDGLQLALAKDERRRAFLKEATLKQVT